MSELEEKIKELRDEYAWKEKAEIMFGDLNPMAYITGRDNELKHISLDLKEKPGRFKSIIESYPPTKMEHIVSNSKITIESPFKLTSINHIRDTGYIRIAYRHNEIEFWITIDVIHIPDFVRQSSRGVYETELHYFGGVSRREINSMRIRTFVFNKEQIGWYGGNSTLVDKEEINAIIEHLKNTK